MQTNQVSRALVAFIEPIEAEGNRQRDGLTHGRRS